MTVVVIVNVVLSAAILLVIVGGLSRAITAPRAERHPRTTAPAPARGVAHRSRPPTVSERQAPVKRLTTPSTQPDRLVRRNPHEHTRHQHVTPSLPAADDRKACGAPLARTDPDHAMCA
jgi:hypothetical protein